MNGLLVDFGGVLTTNVFASFRAFCTDEGIHPDRIKALFRPIAALAAVRALERVSCRRTISANARTCWGLAPPSSRMWDEVLAQSGHEVVRV